ncbi:MAG: homoserine O-acetyltransferase MetA [Bilifractor sp.]|jgi:homoserine O-succinyltransferase|nr:homoserine O-succinyltransferase [Lachnospiraceae bacterium]
MPIKVQNDLPVKEVLENENIFVMDENRAMHQDIRPLQILILNLMPLKEDTELQLLRCLSNSPMQLDITFMIPATHHIKNQKAVSHINKFYVTFDDVRDRFFDGMIVTGAPIEQIPFEEVDYWKELVEIMDWTERHVTSTMYQCWGAQAAIYHFYGIQKRMLPEKMFGLYRHRVHNRKIPLVRGFDDEFWCPHSRHTEVPLEEIQKCSEITVLTDSEEAGFFLGMADEGRKIFVQGHPEYDRLTLAKEYKRDVDKGLKIAVPVNYFPDDDPDKKPILTWRATSAALYANWINYYIYQTTPYDMYGTPDFK